MKVPDGPGRDETVAFVKLVVEAENVAWKHVEDEGI